MSTALVTGGNRGIGQQVCKELATRGWDVIVGARDPAKGTAAANRLRKETGGRVRSIHLDVTDPATITDAHRRLRDGAIRLDALVNNAGVYRDADTQTLFATNFFGPLQTIDALADRLVDGARVVNVSSGLGAASNLDPAIRERMTDPALTRTKLSALVEEYLAGARFGTSDYGVSKAALNALSRILATELAGRRIKVNAISPGWVRTDMGGRNAPRSVEQGAASILWGVFLPDDGPTGGYFEDGRRLE